MNWLLGHVPGRRKSRARFVIFLLPLREPLPLPHLATWTFLGGAHPDLQETLIVPTAEVGPIPEEFEGSLAVSIRIWQQKTEDVKELQEMERVGHVVQAILPKAEYDRLRAEASDEDDEEPAPPITPRELEQLQAELEAGEEPVLYSTIIEAVTPVVDRGGPDPLSDAFDASVEAAAKLVRAFRLSSKLPVSPLTRERLPFLIYFLTRNLVGEPEWSNGLFMTRLLPDPAFAVQPVDDEELAKFTRHLGAIEVQHPLAAQVERRVDAGLALDRLGDTANAVILAELSGVILLDVVLVLLYWGEAASVEATAEALDRPFKSRLTNEYSARLGGNWDLTRRTAAVGRWYSDVYRVRNRVLHADYFPTRDEARAALDAADSLASFLGDRLAERSARFPRSALAFLGDDLDRRGVMTKAVREVESEYTSHVEFFADYVARDEAIDQIRTQP